MDNQERAFKNGIFPGMAIKPLTFEREGPAPPEPDPPPPFPKMESTGKLVDRIKELEGACREFLSSVREKYSLHFNEEFDCPYMRQIEEVLAKK